MESKDSIEDQNLYVANQSECNLNQKQLGKKRVEE